MLLLAEGQTGEAWEPSKQQCSCYIRRAVDTKIMSFLSLESFKS